MRISNCKYQPYERHVQNGLALTPEELNVARLRGEPISTSSLSTLPSDFSTDPKCPSTPLEFRRGTDMNDLWNASKQFHGDFNAKVRQYVEDNPELFQTQSE